MDHRQAAAGYAEPAAVPAQPPPPGTTANVEAPPADASRPPMPPPPPAIPPAKRRKNTNRGRGGAVGAAAASADELVKLGPEVARGSERLRTGWRAVQLSAEDKAAEVALNDRQMCASSSAGYRMVRATHGVYSGTWYYEVRVDKLGPSGAVRLGWATRQAEINAPVGADKHGYSYRSAQGSKVQAGWRDEYGTAFGEGDTVGCLLHLGESGRPFEKGPADVVRYKGKLHFTEGMPGEPQQLPGSFLAFTLNGSPQGMAYEDLWEGTYCPAVSLYTNPTQQAEPASVTVNFGEDGFAFEPPQLAGCPPPRAACEMCGPRPGAEVAAAAAEQQQQEPALAAQEEGQQQASGGRQGTEQPQQQTEEQRGEGQLPRGTQAADGEAALLSDAPAAAAVQA